MKTYISFLILLSVFIISCSNFQKKGDKATDNTSDLRTDSSVLENEHTVDFEVDDENLSTYNWGELRKIKENLLEDLKTKKKPVDHILVKFLKDYKSLINEFNEILFRDKDYELLNTLIYADENNIHQIAKDFKKLVESNGLSIAFSEGTIYIEINTDFIINETLEIINDSLAIEFLKLYCEEIDKKCCDDAALIISEKELINRIYYWGKILEKSSGNHYEEIAKKHFNSYKYIAFNGMDNSPSFDWKTKKFNELSFNAMQEIVKKYPNSIAAKEFKPFIDLLISENFKKTELIIEYLSKY